MRIENHHSDKAVLTEIGKRLTRIRLARNLSQAQLASNAGVGKNTVQRLEMGEGVALASFVRVLRGLGLLSELEMAIPESAPSPIEQLERSGAERKRASGPRSGTKWRWGTP